MLDGNQKNNRPVCAAEEAGFVEYAGLPGKVKTGCMATPEQSSLFCSLHKPRLSKALPTQLEGHRGVIEMILRKKETRSAIHYEVYGYTIAILKTSRGEINCFIIINFLDGNQIQHMIIAR